MLLLPLVNLGTAGGSFELPDMGITRRREPRVVVALMFDIESIYLTSRTGISNVPGNVIYGCIEDLSSSSQQLFPDEGRVTIGGMTLVATDLSGAITTALRDQYQNNLAAVRGREVRVFEAESDDFRNLARQETYVIESVEYDAGAYRFTCADRSREMRLQVFDQASTRLKASLAAGTQGDGSVMEVLDAEGFETMTHTVAFTEASGAAAIGYVLVKKTKEIIGYTAKDTTTRPQQLKNLLRGRFGTLPQDIPIEAGAADDRQPEIEEFIYLEMPLPQLIYSILTGVVLGHAFTLPSRWHLGIAQNLINTADFNNIGTDLYDPYDDAAGLVVKFEGLKKTDGKRFIEEQLHLLAGTFSPINEEGLIGLKRLNRIVDTSAASFELNEDYVIEHGALEHDQAAVVNNVDIEWVYDWQQEEFLRRSQFVNLVSAQIYRDVKTRTFSFRGLRADQAARATMRRFSSWMAERYGGHPIRLSLKASMRARTLRVGHVANVTLPHVRDWAGTSTLNRSMEVQERSINHLTGEIDLTLAGAAVVTTNPPPEPESPIADLWYVSEGSPLDSVLSIVGGVVQSSGTVTGQADLRDVLSILFHVGNLTIPNGVTVTIEQNVQLRVLGAITLSGNGKIDGKGNGLAPLADPNVVGTAWIPGPQDTNLPTFGTTRAATGLQYFAPTAPVVEWSDVPKPNYQTGQAAVPVPELRVVSGNLEGLPSELRGSAGVQGSPVVEWVSSVITTRSLGTAGGASGAGLAIITRGGLFFSGTALIDLSGDDGVQPSSTVSLGGKALYAGAGGGGAPGALLVVLDGGTVDFPDLSGVTFVANRGATQVVGTPIDSIPILMPIDTAEPWRGFSGGLPAENLWLPASRYVWAEPESGTGDGLDQIVPTPVITDISVGPDGAVIELGQLAEDSYDTIQIWASIDNNLQNALEKASGRGQTYSVTIQGVQTLWYWARAIKGGRVSAWSTESTDGFRATAGFPSVPPTTLSNTWAETFDGYTNINDILAVWRVFGYVGGIGTELFVDHEVAGYIRLDTGGMNGGKVLRIIGTCVLAKRTPIPYDAGKLYRVEGRFRRAGTVGDDQGTWMGFYSLQNDGTTINGGGSIGDSTGVTWALLDTFNATNVFGTGWYRPFAWIGGAHDTILATGAGDAPSNTGRLAFLNHEDMCPARVVTMRSDSGISPAYILPVIAHISQEQQHIDYIRIDRADTSDPLADGLIDGNFSSANDSEYWTAYEVANGLLPQLALGAGEGGNNALKWPNVTSFSAAPPGWSRFPVRLVGDTITIAFVYKIQDHTGTIDGASSIKFTLNGLKASSTNPRRYDRSPGTRTLSPLFSSELVVDNAWHAFTLTFTSVFSTHLPTADGIQLSIQPDATVSAENFSVWISRVRLLQT